MIAENLHIIRENIEAACRRSGRHADEIKIIAVSKHTGLGDMSEAFNAGIVDFGESKAQELSEKNKVFDKTVKWHFIGHLQKNKAKYVVPAASLIHSVDSEDLAQEIQKQALKYNKIQNILIEAKTSNEESKQGIADLQKIMELATFCKSLPNVNLMGLMTMAPFTFDEQAIRKSFATLRDYKEILNEKGLSLTELSMGMTNDYMLAIEEGATIIRIGTGIFGPRDYSKSWKEL